MTLKIPLNRFITFIKPAINVAAGGVAAWLVAKINVLGVLGIDQDQLATQISAGMAAILTSGFLQLGDLKWLRGHHIELEGIAAATAAPATDVHSAIEEDHATADIPAGDLPDDAEEFAAPPPAL